MKRKLPKLGLKKFRVFVAQVNQDYVDVMARYVDEARTKGYNRWRKDRAHSYVLSVEEQQPFRPL